MLMESAPSDTLAMDLDSVLDIFAGCVPVSEVRRKLWAGRNNILGVKADRLTLWRYRALLVFVACARSGR